MRGFMDVLLEGVSGRSVGHDGAGRRDMIGGDRGAQERERTCWANFDFRDWVHGNAVEVGWVLYIG